MFLLAFAISTTIMTDPMLHPEDDVEVEGAVDKVAPHLAGNRHQGWRGWRWLAYIIGVGLVGMVVYVAYDQTDWSGIRDAEPITLLYLCLLIVFSMATNAFLFGLLTKPFEEPDRPILMREWLGLITASSLLNYLPKAGMLGRIAYLKKFHGISLKANTFILIALGAGTCGVYLLMLLLTLWRRELDALWWVGLGAGLGFGTGISYPLMKLSAKRITPDSATLQANIIPAIGVWYLVRTLDTFCFAGRVYFAAQIFGQPMTLITALTVGLSRNFIVMVAPIPNGFGVSEWVSASVSKLLSGMPLSDGVGVMVIDRAAEILVFVATGLPGIAYLHKRSNERN